jgi:hypothetical protein
LKVKNNLTKGDCIRVVNSAVFYDMKNILMRQATKDFILDSEIGSLHGFIDYLLADLFYKETGLNE